MLINDKFEGVDFELKIWTGCDLWYECFSRLSKIVNIKSDKIDRSGCSISSCGINNQIRLFYLNSDQVISLLYLSLIRVQNLFRSWTFRCEIHKKFYCFSEWHNFVKTSSVVKCLLFDDVENLKTPLYWKIWKSFWKFAMLLFGIFTVVSAETVCNGPDYSPLGEGYIRPW